LLRPHRRAQISTVAVVPPTVEVVEVVFKGDNHPLPDLRFQTTQLQSALVRADAQMFRVAEMSKSDAENYRDTLGTDVIPIADRGGADALVVGG